MKGRWILAALIAVDLTTKELARLLLPPHRGIDSAAVVQLVLRNNSSGLGTWGQAATHGSTTSDGAAGGIGLAVVGVSLLVLRQSRWSRPKKSLVVVGAYLLAVILSAAALRTVAAAPVSLWIALARAGGATLFTSLWCLAPPGWWRIATTLLAAAALGNLVSLIFPPYAITDFLFSRPVSSLLGWGVFNIADLYYFVGIVGLVVALLIALASRFRLRDRPAA
jgi:hypothetical protein